MSNPKRPSGCLVTSQHQLAGVVADLKDIDLIALDLETTGLNPRDSIRLLSLATKDATTSWTARMWTQRTLPYLTEATVVAHNALFDVRFLSPLGFELRQGSGHHDPLPVALRGAKAEPLKRG